MLLLIGFQLISIKENYFISHSEESVMTKYCVFAYIDIPDTFTKYKSNFIDTIRIIYSSGEMYLIEKQDYDQVIERKQDLLYVTGCPTIFLVKEVVQAQNATKSGQREQIKVDVFLDLITPVKDVNNYDPTVRNILNTIYFVVFHLLTHYTYVLGGTGLLLARRSKGFAKYSEQIGGKNFENL